MDRAYDNIPRQGEHGGKALGDEPSTSVRAQQPVQPIKKSKATSSVHVLSVDRRRGLYRLDLVPRERAEEGLEGFEEVARVPDGGDLGGLFERIPDLSRHAVFENTNAGTRHYSADRRITENWADEGAFDRVTIFADKDEADEYARAVKEGEAAK